MKIKEVTQNEADALYEALDVDNDTGVATEKLVEMVEAHKSDNWTTYTSVSDLMEAMREYRKNFKQGK